MIHFLKSILGVLASAATLPKPSAEISSAAESSVPAEAAAIPSAESSAAETGSTSASFGLLEGTGEL